QLMASQSFFPKQVSPILPEPAALDWNLLLSEFVKNPPLAPQMNLQDIFLAQLNEFKKQLINQQFEQMIKAMNEAPQKVKFEILSKILKRYSLKFYILYK